jgi:hypothetical protein
MRQALEVKKRSQFDAVRQQPGNGRKDFISAAATEQDSK